VVDGPAAGIAPLAASRYAFPSYLLLAVDGVAIILEVLWLRPDSVSPPLVLLRVHNGFALWLLALFAFSLAMLLSWFFSSMTMAPEHAEHIALTFVGMLGYVYVGWAGWHQYSSDPSELVQLARQIKRACGEVLPLLGNPVKAQVD
jgi:hypothetical protein